MGLMGQTKYSLLRLARIRQLLRYLLFDHTPMLTDYNAGQSFQPIGENIVEN